MSNGKADSKKPLTLPTIYGNLDITLKQPHFRRKADRIFDIVQDFRVRVAKDRDTVSLPGREHLSLPEIDPHKKVSPSRLLTRQATFTKPRSRQSWHSSRTVTSFQRSILDENEKDLTRRLTEKKTKKLLGELYTDKQYLEYIVSEYRNLCSCISNRIQTLYHYFFLNSNLQQQNLELIQLHRWIGRLIKH